MELVILFLLSFFFCLKATASDIHTADTAKNSKLGYFAYPYAFYTPETNLAFGIGSMVYFRFSDSSRIKPSRILTSFYYTINNQFNFNLEPLLHFKGPWEGVLQSKVTYFKEIPKFYGIGNGSQKITNPEFELRKLGITLELGGDLAIMENFSGGILYENINVDITDKKDNPFLNSENIYGSNGGRISGLGLLLLIDNRDNIFYPSEKGYYKLNSFNYNDWLGGEYNFNRLVLDLRQYFNFKEKNIIALQAYSDMTFGNVPFFALPEVGGSERMRGVFQGRYRDKMYFTTQAEYRRHVWWRLGFTAFVGIGQVGPDTGAFHLDGFKTAYGGGLRVLFDEKEKINIRFDVGFSEGETNIYFSLEEAF